MDAKATRSAAVGARIEYETLRDCRRRLVVAQSRDEDEIADRLEDAMGALNEGDFANGMKELRRLWRWLGLRRPEPDGIY